MPNFMSLRGGRQAAEVRQETAESVRTNPAVCWRTIRERRTLRLLRPLQGLAMTLLLILCLASPLHASEWAKKEGYWAKTGGKFVFGLKYILFSFSEPWLESNEPEYKREWEGFCAGLGKFVVYEAAGIIHLVTFPIPVDVPDVGIGLHLPSKDCPMRHNPNWKPGTPDSKKNLALVPPPKKSAGFAASSASAERPAKAPLTVEAERPASL